MSKNNFHFNTKILGLIGHPIKHSFSPFIHNVAIELKKLDYIYLPFNVPPANLKDALRGMLALDFAGLNVTIPHKESILVYLNNLSEEASIIGSVNTVVNDHGKLTGYNTDVNGILETLLPYKDDIAGNEAVVVGAGGSARAVIYTLIRHFKPSKINLINRTEQRADSLRKYFSDKMKYDSFRTKELFPPNLVDIFSGSKIIINATSVGMAPETDDVITSLEKSFVKDQIVFDLVYNPTKTKLMQIAASQEAICINGINMLIFQAAKSFELWTGEQMPVENVQEALKLFLAD